MPRTASAAFTRSGVNGISRRRAPVASKTALPIAAATAVIEASPAPFASADGCGTSTNSTTGVRVPTAKVRYVRQSCDVTVDQDTGRVQVTRLVVAQDSGPISNPDGMRNQLEGGALQGMSRALGEEVTWDDQKVTSIDWRTFHSLPLGIDVPVIESVLINRTDAEACGSGETSITVVAPAIGNAVFDATGVRVRQVPLTPERVLAALRAS